MKTLRRLWLRFILESYRHDAAHLAEYIEKAKRDYRNAQLNIVRLENELRDLVG